MENQTPLNIFIMYAPEDIGALRELKTQLQPLVRGKSIVIWDDGDMLPGHDRTVTLTNRLQHADLVLVLISKDFLASEEQYALLQKALAGRATTKQVLIPVILRACLWQEAFEISQFQVLPPNGQPVYSSQSARSDEAMLLVAEGVKKAVDALRENKKSSSSTPKLKFNPHHQFTCDRTGQYEAFIKLLNDASRDRCHFFYLFGGEAQAHRGIFQRFVNRLKGIDLDYLHANRTSGFEVAHYSISVPCMEDMDCLKDELSRMILAEMEINDQEMERMAEKNLAFGLAKSPLLSKISPQGKILFHFNITEALWDAQVIPELTRAFVKDFCLKNLPPDAPELFFFFSVEYDDDNQTIREEVRTALGKAELLKSLGELKMVNPSHIEKWFALYEVFWETSIERRRTKNRYFDTQNAEMFMEEVQILLKKVIDDINNEEKYGKRNQY